MQSPNQDSQSKPLSVTLRGIRPMLFDRYAGDNSTQLKPLEKLYLNSEGGLVFPVLNVFSLLSAQNTDSVAARFHGKKRRDVALGINAFCSVTPRGVVSEEIVDAPILDAEGKQWMANDPRIQILKHVARVKKAGTAIPNPKERPMIPTGWRISLDFRLVENDFVSETTLRNMIEQGGILGLGTFRPMFGRYVCEWE